MYKAIFSLISLIPFFFYSLLDGEDVTITQKLPEKMELNETYQIDLIFNKGEAVQGFGKFQASFPEGIAIEMVEGAGATFTYTDGVMKLIWVNLPSENQFVVSYEITADENCLSKIQVGGKFSYLKDNERKSFAMLPESVQVGDEEELAMEDAEEEEAEEFSLNIFRKVQKQGEDRYDVSIVIQKTGIKGFSKIEEYVPRGAAVEGNETMNASFSYVKNKIKFVWLVTPEEKEIIVTYSVDLSEASDKDIFNTFGEYSYLNDKNKTEKVLIETRQANMKVPEKKEEPVAEVKPSEAPTELNIGGVNIKLREATEEGMAEINAGKEENKEEPAEEMASNEPSSQPEESSETNQEQPSDPEEETMAEVQPKQEESSNETEEMPETQPAEPVAEMTTETKSSEEPTAPAQEETKEEPANSNMSGSTTSNVPAPQTGVFYRVQIAAGKNVVDARYFDSRHSWKDPFVVENHEGWVKYTTNNSFPVYKEARDQRNSISSNFNFDGPFVTAYNSGERITVQEALMITNQKWFK